MRSFMFWLLGVLVGAIAIYIPFGLYQFGSRAVVSHVVSHDTGSTVLELNIPNYQQPYEGVTITVDAKPIKVQGSRINVGDVLSDTVLDFPAEKFNEVVTGSIASFSGYKLIHVVPSLDTPVCTRQTKELESAAALFPDVTFIVVSNDTPFALNRFCSTNSIDNLKVFSDARTRQFGMTNGLFMPDYGLLTRALIIVDDQMKVLYIDYAEEVTQELDVLNALAFLKQQIE